MGKGSLDREESEKRQERLRSIEESISSSVRYLRYCRNCLSLRLIRDEGLMALRLPPSDSNDSCSDSKNSFLHPRRRSLAYSSLPYDL